jgi:SAM-dependent methyltransferase
MSRDSSADAVQAWERYAVDVGPRRSANAAGALTWFNWTQYPDHGPDETVLGDVRGCTVLELGSGRGANLAHLAMLGAHCIGVDLAPSREHMARQAWGHLPNVDFRTADAIEFMASGSSSFDTIYSVFGATWFCDPAELIPLVRGRLRPGGVFAFSHMPSSAVGIRRAPTAGAGKAVTRQDHPGSWWARRLANSGFLAVEYSTIPAPTPGVPGTLLVRAVGP